MMTEQEWRGFHTVKQKRLAESDKVVYLLDGNGEPLLEIAEYRDLSAPQADGESASAKLIVPIRSEFGQDHPLISELIAEDLGTQDEEGRLVVATQKTRMLLVEHQNGIRFCYRITHCVAKGGQAYPAEIEINGVETTSILSRLPAFSVPHSAKHAKVRTYKNDFARNFKKERHIAGIRMGHVLDGYTKEGPADEIITEIIRESLDALAGIFSHFEKGQFPYAVERIPGGTSPRALIPVRDEDILSTVEKTAQAAGVGITSRIVFPYEEGNNGITAPQIKFVVSQR